MTDAHPGHEALVCLDRVLQRRPFKDDQELSHATRCLATFREALIHIQRRDEVTEADRERLARLNAIISVVMGMHFPLGHAPWGELEKAQRWLGELVAETER